MSYAATTTLVNTITTNAQFRTWGAEYSAKFASMGLVKVVEAAQIDWVAVATPGVANTAAGYEMWRMNDALQATVPIFIKFEFGSGAAAANASLWFSLGTSSNGAGVLNGIVSTRTQIQCTATALAITHYWSGDTNRVGVSAVGAAMATSMYFGIERTVDTAGAVSGEGALLIRLTGSAWGTLAWNQAIGSYTTWESTVGAMGPSVVPYGVTGLQVAVYPVYHSKGVFCNPGLNGFLYENLTIGAGATVSFTVYGAAHTYMPVGAPQHTCAGRGGFSAPAFMIRYE